MSKNKSSVLGNTQVKNSVFNFDQWLTESKKQVTHPKQYKAPEGSSRDKKLDKSHALLKAGKKEEAYRLRDEMEKKERGKSGWKNTPRKDSKVNESKKRETLSKETRDKIKKVAQKKGYSYSDLVQEYKKGLGAYYSSGSRPGMTAHQWAMARVNAASPSKSWANVKSTKK
jgi:Skp family chaperone for outer membrane proteins